MGSLPFPSLCRDPRAPLSVAAAPRPAHPPGEGLGGTRWRKSFGSCLTPPMSTSYPKQPSTLLPSQSEHEQNSFTLHRNTMAECA